MSRRRRAEKRKIDPDPKYHSKLLSKFINKVEEIAARHGYPISDIGGYLQPIEHNRACHLEFNFFYDPANSSLVEGVRSLYLEAALTLLDEGALFPRV